MGKRNTIEKIYSRSECGVVPTLLNFQNGNLTATGKNKALYCTMVNKQTNSKQALIAVEGNVYTGPVNDNEANELTDLYICARNKETNKVRIMPIDQAILKNRIYDNMQQKQLETVAKKPVDETAAKKRFIKEFSGSKIKRIMDTKEKMQISLDVIKEGLETTIEQTTIAKEEETELQRETYVELIRPKFNKNAETIDVIYDINDLVPQELLRKLDAEANAVLTAASDSLPIKSEYLLLRLEKLKQSSKTQTEILDQIKIIIFMDALFNLIKSKVRDLYKMELSGITAKVETYIRRNFALPGAAMLMKLKKKALCYYMVLCMLINGNHAVNTTMLAKELGLRLPEIIQHANVVNALPSRSEKDCVALTLPSKVPPLKSAFKKKRKTL